jgi:hypothetical protein
MVEIKDFDYLFKCVVNDVYKDMLRYKEQHKEELEGVVPYEFLRLYWLDNVNDFDDYIMDMCEPNENAWAILTHYETSPVRLLYEHSDAEYSLRRFSDAVAKEATDKILSQL